MNNDRTLDELLENFARDLEIKGIETMLRREETPPKTFEDLLAHARSLGVNIEKFISDSLKPPEDLLREWNDGDVKLGYDDVYSRPFTFRKTAAVIITCRRKDLQLRHIRSFYPRKKLLLESTKPYAITETVRTNETLRAAVLGGLQEELGMVEEPAAIDFASAVAPRFERRESKVFAGWWSYAAIFEVRVDLQEPLWPPDIVREHDDCGVTKWTAWGPIDPNETRWPILSRD